MKLDPLISVDVHLEDGFKASGTSPPSKTCSACGKTKPTKDYYSKGTRIDSSCKDCQKQKKKTKYVANKGQDVVAGLTAIFEITSQGLGRQIRSEIEKLNEVIRCLQKSKR